MFNRIKSLTALLLALLLSVSMAACGNANNADNDTTTATVADTTTPEPEIVQKNGDMTLMVGDESLFTIIRGEDASENDISAAQAFNKQIAALTDNLMTMHTDDFTEADANALEILIGATNRPESAALAESLPEKTFGIRTTDSKIVIAADDDINLARAIEYFFDNVTLAFDEATGHLHLSTSLDYVSEPYDFFTDILPTSDTFASDANKVLSIAAPTELCTIVQGGYTDDKYHYQAFIYKHLESNEAENIVKIVKTDLATGDVVKISPDLPLNHANDITYNPKLDRLVVVHNNPNRTSVSMVDPETLELIETKTIPYSIYSIDYNESRDMYVVGLSGGQSFTFLDGNLERISGMKAAKPTKRTNGYTTQGAAADDNYIYFVLYNQNVITVYDWDFNFVTLIELDLGRVEPENISIVGNTIYVASTGSGGATLWRVTPKAKTE